MRSSQTKQSEVAVNWKVLLAVLVGVGCGTPYLPFYTLGPLINPLNAEFGWSRAQIQAALLFSTSVGAIAAPIIGWIIDRSSAKRVAIACLFGLSGAFLAASVTSSLIALYACYVAMAAIGAGAGPVTWTRIINTRFIKQRGLALAVTLSGTGLCAILAPQYVTYIEELYGWRIAYVALSLLPVILAVPVITFFVRETNSGNLAPTDKKIDWGYTLNEAIKSYKFWVMAGSIFLLYTVATGLVANLVPLITDKGYTPAQAAQVMGGLGVSIIVGRLVVGMLIDRFWAPAVGASVLWMPAAAALLLVGDTGYSGLWLAAALIGFAAGAELDMMAYLCSRYFGLTHYGKIYALLYSVLAVAGGFAPIGYALVFDMTGNYDWVLYMSVPFALIGAMMLLALGKYPKESAH